MTRRAPTRHYTNFDLSIVDLQDGTFDLRGVDSFEAVNEVHGVVLPPRLLEATMTSVRDPAAARTLGTELFEAVFPGVLSEQLRERLQDVRRPGRGLRLRLRLDKAPRLASIPWELLHDPVGGYFIGQSNATPIVRYMELPQGHRPLACRPPLRVLAVLAQPEDLVELDVDGEWQRLQQALRPLQTAGLVTLERLQPPTLAALQTAMRQRPPHVLHCVGHGGTSASQDPEDDLAEGCFYFKDAAGLAHPVSGQDLGRVLRDGSLRLAFVNSCRSAAPTAASPVSGLAEELLRQGVAAVLGMGDQIFDTTALTFTETFYSALADGLPVDAAVAEARKAMAPHGDGVDWALPRLFLRAHDGVLFEWPADRRRKWWGRWAVAAVLAGLIGCAGWFVLRQQHVLAMRGHNAQALQWIEANRPDAARRELNDALAKDPRHAETWSNLGTLEATEGRSGAALKAFRRAAELAPGSAVHHFNLASRLLDAQRFDEAVSHLQRAAELDPLDGDVLNDLGWANLRARRFDAARSSLARGLALDVLAPQTRATLHKNYGRLSFESDDPATAVEHLEVALRTLDPALPGPRLEALLYLAAAHEALDQPQRACVHLQNFADADGALYRWSLDAGQLARRLDCTSAIEIPSPLTGPQP